MKRQLVIAALCAIGFISHAQASERIDHAKPLPSDTIEQAVANLSQYNQKLADVLKQQPLTADSMHEAHMLSYTLEVALKKMSDELAKAAESLEEMHLASERLEDQQVLLHGGDYLKITRTIVK